MSNKSLANICAKHGFPEAVVDAMKNIPTVDVNELTGGLDIYGMVVVPDLVANDQSAAAANTSKIQDALDTGGRVFVGEAGEIYINDTLIIHSNTSLLLGGSTKIKHAAGVNKNLMRNVNFGAQDGSSWVGITSITTADNKTATVHAPGHPFVAGGYAHITGAVQEYYNNVFDVLTVPDADHFTIPLETAGLFAFASATSVSTAITGTTTATSKIVTGVSTLTGIYPGMVVTGTGVPAGTFIDTIDAAGQFTLNQAATGANAGLTCSFPLRCTKADKNITVEGGEWSYNATNQSVSDSHAIYGIVLRNVKNVAYRNIRFSDIGGSAINTEGGYDIVYDNIGIQGGNRYSSNGLHPIQGCGKNIIVNNIHGNTKDDFISCIQKEYIQYMDAGWPIGTISDVFISNIRPDGCLSAIKALPCPGQTFNNLVISNISGRVSSVNTINLCYDAVNTGVYTSAAVGSLGRVVVDDVSLLNNLANVALLVSVTVKSIRASKIEFATTTGKLLSVPVTGNVTSLEFVGCDIYGTAAVLLMQILGTVSRVRIKNCDFKGVTSGILKFETGAAAPYLDFDGVVVDTCGSFLLLSGQQGVKGSLRACRYINYLASFIACSNSPQAFLRFFGCEIPDANLYSGTWNNAAFWYSDNYGSNALTAAATTLVDGLRNPRKKLTVNQNLTIANPTNILQYNNQEGYELTFVLTEDATGNHTITWGSNYVFPSAFVQSGVGSANKLSVVKFTFDGVSKFVCTSGANVWN